MGEPGPEPTLEIDVSGLEPGHTVMFPFNRGGDDLQGFVINDEGTLRAYVNRCAHVTYSLDLGDGRVMDRKRRSIVCSVHGARYLPRTGFCFEGPALGRSLESLPVRREEDTAHVTITAEPTGWPITDHLDRAPAGRGKS